MLTDDDALWEKAWAFKDHGKSYDAVYRPTASARIPLASRILRDKLADDGDAGSDRQAAVEEAAGLGGRPAAQCGDPDGGIFAHFGVAGDKTAGDMFGMPITSTMSSSGRSI